MCVVERGIVLAILIFISKKEVRLVDFIPLIIGILFFAGVVVLGYEHTGTPRSAGELLCYVQQPEYVPDDLGC
jgi:hypothetical protein